MLKDGVTGVVGVGGGVVCVGDDIVCVFALLVSDLCCWLD